MRKRLIIVATMAFVLLLVAIFGVKYRVGDIRPVILPAKKQVVGSDPGLVVSSGFKAGVFATGLPAARDLEVTKEGALLVSLKSEGKVVALPDDNKDGVAEPKTVIEGLNNPHGLAFYDGELFVAEETSVISYSWNEAKLLAVRTKKLFDLPAGGRHSTRSLVFNSKGQLFVSLGSTCDVCVEKHPWIGTVIVSDKNGTSPRVYSKGLRNAVFIAARGEQLWGTEMGRDNLGDNIPPDEVNLLVENQNYGWPYCYSQKVPDTTFGGTTARCSATIGPVYEIPAHSAPLGLSFIKSQQFPADWQGDLLVAYHGSWNRSTPAGYKVVRMKIVGDKITGEEDFLTNFLRGSQVIGRPVDVAFDKEGSLYVSDDKAGAVYKVVKY